MGKYRLQNQMEEIKIVGYLVSWDIEIGCNIM